MLSELPAALPAAVSDPLYYLHNFRTVLAWVGARYDALLNEDERAFLCQFNALPQPAQALLVRLVMRKGLHFRSDRLDYAEIGSIESAAAPLLTLGWLRDDVALTLDELFALLTRLELETLFGRSRGVHKEAWLDQLKGELHQAQPFPGWWPDSGERLYSLAVQPLCDTFRLLFFGNLQQQWSEFVLADLGIHQYEAVPFGPESRPFRHRDDVDYRRTLHQCAERFDAGDEPSAVAEALPPRCDSAWLTRRRERLLFQLARQCERNGELDLAEKLYADCHYAGARARRVRMLERLGQIGAAHTLAQQALQAPESEAEQQQLLRSLPRLHRALDLPKPSTRHKMLEAPSFTLTLTQPDDGSSVEWAVLEYLHRDPTPAFYVENTLINALFGLLCWDAVFAPLPGAFFHPFQIAPSDLSAPDFSQRRSELFAHALAALDNNSHGDLIRRRYRDKFGIASPFVAWEALDEALLDLALTTLPPAHLKRLFERLLQDVRANRSGLPDLIQFEPEARRYRMIEVKGPGDRLQDNQQRWLHYCMQHGIPVEVCYVEWGGNSP